MKINYFAKFSWGFLGYNLLVIIWGAYVRASGSGAGCGAHWPLCNGQVIPQSTQLATAIEFTHRIMSGLTLIGSVLLFVWAWRVYSKGSPIRLAAGFTLLFTLTEAIVGAGLVLFELVANNASLIRAASVAIHLVNTLILLGFLTLTAWLSSGGQVPRWKGHQRIGVILGIALLGAILLCASGAVTALGDTLFPSESLSEGLAQDISPTANFLIRLRVYHPIIAITVGTYLLISILWTGLEKVASPIKRMSMLMIGLFAIQLVLGLTNVFLLAPVWLQLVHLFVSDLVWIALVILTLVHLSQPLPETYQVNPHLLRSAPE